MGHLLITHVAGILVQPGVYDIQKLPITYLSVVELWLMHQSVDNLYVALPAIKLAGQMLKTLLLGSCCHCILSGWMESILQK